MAALNWPKIGLFPSVRFTSRFSETGRTMDASRFTFHTPIGVNVETLRGRLKRGQARRVGRAVRGLPELAGPPSN
jgi:hypothetical protein